MQKFAILGYPRTGSNLLCATLDQHPDVVCHYELFNPDVIIKHRNNNIYDNKLLKERDLHPQRFMDNMFEQESARAVGFKIFPTDNDLIYDHCLNNPEFKVIILDRENLLGQYSSRAIAEHTQVWITTQGTKKDKPKVEFIRADFEDLVEQVEEQRSVIANALASSDAEKYIKVKYSQIAYRPTLRSLDRFLGVPYFEIAFPRFKKQNSPDILSRFANPEDAISALSEMGKPEWATEEVSEWKHNEFRRFWSRGKRKLVTALKS